MNEEDTSDPEDNHGLGRISVSLVNNNEYRKIKTNKSNQEHLIKSIIRDGEGGSPAYKFPNWIKKRLKAQGTLFYDEEPRWSLW